MNQREATVYLWGNGGYYRLRRLGDGSLTVPEGREVWESFARFAPAPLLLAALHTLQEGSTKR